MPTLVQAIATIKAGRRAEGRAMLEQLLITDPRNVNALLWMTEVANTTDERRDYLNRVLTIDPNNPTAYNGLVRLNALTEKSPTELLVNSVLKNSPAGESGVEVTEIGKAIAFIKNGNLPEARKLLAQILVIDPNKISALFCMIDVAKDDVERQEYLDRALAIEPNNRFAIALKELEKMNSSFRAVYKNPDSNPARSLEVGPSQFSALHTIYRFPEESSNRILIGRTVLVIFLLIAGLVIITVLANNRNVSTTNDILHATDNGYAWHSASYGSKASLCRNLAGIFSNNGVTHSWNFYYDVLNSVYNTTDPNVLKQPINEVAADAAVMSNAP